MDDPSQLWLTIFVFFGLLLLSVFFSGSETAYFSLSKACLRKIRNRKDDRSIRVTKMLDQPRELLITLLIGNTVVNTAAASLAAVMVDNFARKAGYNPTVALIVDMLVVSFVLIVIVEISPKVFALKHNENWALRVSRLVRLCMFFLWPFSKTLVGVTSIFAKTFGVEYTRTIFTDEELRSLAEVAEEHGALDQEEREMIHSIFEFGETEAREVMVPRIDIIAISEDALLREAVELIQEKGHSRIPVYHENVDHIVGILYAKDLIGKPLESSGIPDLMRQVDFIPESKLISSLLKEFQEHNRHMVIVVDEYGGTEGLVTLEDVIEEIVGEIQDEYDQEEVLFKRLDNGEILIDAKIEVDVFNKEIGEDIIPTEEDYETMGGFIFSIADKVPDTGHGYKFNEWNFKVKSVENNRVGSISITPPEDFEIPVTEDSK